MRLRTHLLIYSLSVILLTPLYGQDAISIERSQHQGIFSQAFVTMQTLDRKTGESTPVLGISLGFYQHIDLSSRMQFRGGGGLAYAHMRVKDYSPTFSDDIDPITGVVDYKKSYVTNDLRTLRLIAPLNLRYKFTESANHGYLSAGIEGRYAIHSGIEAQLQESGLDLRPLDPEPFYYHRRLNAAGTLEAGYEFKTGGTHKFNISTAIKYGLLTEFSSASGLESRAFRNIIHGHSLEIGIGFGLIL